MSKTVNIGDLAVGAGAPPYVIAEIGINHNGDLDLARQMIDAQCRELGIDWFASPWEETSVGSCCAASS